MQYQETEKDWGGEKEAQEAKNVSQHSYALWLLHYYVLIIQKTKKTIFLGMG